MFAAIGISGGELPRCIIEAMGPQHNRKKANYVIDNKNVI